MGVRLICHQLRYIEACDEKERRTIIFIVAVSGQQFYRSCIPIKVSLGDIFRDNMNFS